MKEMKQLGVDEKCAEDGGMDESDGRENIEGTEIYMEEQN